MQRVRPLATAGDSPAGARLPARKPADRYHHGALREALLSAAADIIDADGAEALSLRECARRAGVSSAAVFRHFPDGRALLTAYAAQGFDMLAAEVAREQTGVPEEPMARFRAMGIAYCRFALDHPNRFRVMFRHGPIDPGDPALMAAGGRLEAMLTQGIEPLLPAGEDPARQAAKRAIAWAAAHGLAALLIDGPLGEKVPEAAREGFVRATVALMEPVFAASAARG